MTIGAASARTFWGFVLGGLFLCLPALAGQGPAYSYGEQWWSEYRCDKGTNLLLHFGAPQVTGAQRVKTAVARKLEDENLISNAELKGLDNQNKDDRRVQTMKVAELPPVDESTAKPGFVLDYSDKRLKIELGKGCAIQGDAGRFGAGLACDGTGALRATVNGVESVEAWIKVAEIPKNEACIFSLAKDESRLLLRPDGKLEFRLKNPHGEFDRTKMSDVAIQAMQKKSAEIVSPKPISVGEWTHVIVRKQHHAMPGGGEPWDAKLVVNGDVVAGYQSERYNKGGGYMGENAALLVIGNSAAGADGFKGMLDEVRVSNRERVFYERPAMPWRDAAAVRVPQFDRPWFRNDSTAFHISFDKGMTLDRGPAETKIELNLQGQKPDDLLVDGIRGKGIQIDPELGFPRVRLPGMNTETGALEFWARPVNWDDTTGYWSHSPPLNKDLSIARVYTRGKNKGERAENGNEDVLAFNVTLPRAFNLEQHRIPVDPGHWMHLALVWDAGGWGLYCNGKGIGGGRRDPAANLKADILYFEFGVNNRVTAKNGEPPRIEIDEVVGYTGHLRQDEVEQARKRWMETLQPIPLFQADFAYKYSLQKLEFALQPLLPESVKPAAASVSLVDSVSGKAVFGPLAIAAPSPDGRFRAVISEGKAVVPGAYRFEFSITDDAGKEVVKNSRDWKFEDEPWRNSRAGILDKVPPPWTPITADGKTLSTRMTRYSFGADGLPAEIFADGVNILKEPLQILEDGKPLAGKIVSPLIAKEMDASWSAAFAGSTCDIAMQCRAEYDGMIRYELALKPKGKVGRIAFVMPIKAENATRWLAYPAGMRGPNTGVVENSDGVLLSSRDDPAIWEVWHRFEDAKKKNSKLAWEDYFKEAREKRQAYGFYTHADLNDMNRGLWWFCDNAAGWAQSKSQGAVEIVRKGGTVSLVLNLVAEPVEYTPGKPIVFAILPHPARPLPETHRLLERVDPKVNPLASSAFDAFMPWPTSPRSGGESLNMTLFPAADPAKPEAGPSWDYAASCIPIMKATKPAGYRTLYLSRAWFSCRAGAYDNWEWRSGESGAVSLTPYFNNYLCWEMNEWIGRGIFDAIYLDECYETAARNLEAGFSVKLPDGSEQPGVTNFAFRELMQRWRGIFHQHGLEPMMMAHHTYSFQYPGLMYCDALLDGENFPIVSLNSRDWIDSVSLTHYEATQSGRMWGVTPFWMPFVSEGGFENKAKSQFKKWQWRMARQAQSVFAHFEIATAYEGQGAQVYKAYWKDVLGWGAGDLKIQFVPYWQAAPALTVEGQGKDALVSYYRENGRLLLIASNRLAKECELRIKLDRTALGLKPAAAVKVLDSGAVAPAGDDFVKDKLLGEAKATDPAALLKGNSLAGDDDLLEDAGMKAKEKLKAFLPRWDGDVLIVPVHARDFRMVGIE